MIDLARDAMTPHLAMWTRLDLASPPEDVAAWLARAASVADGADDDLHRRFVLRHDAPEHADPSRAERYLAALDEARARADRGDALTLDALAQVQGLALGASGPAPLRTTDAYARGGAHRYPHVEGLGEVVRARLVAWGAPGLDVVVAACGLYLDVIFTHPFDDGNARAARLCCEWAFRRARRPAPRVEDLLRIRKTPGDERAFWRMVRLGAASITSLSRRAHP